MTNQPTSQHIAIVVPDLSGGGQARIGANLASALADQGHRVDLLFFVTPGPHPYRVSPRVNVVDLRTGSNLRQLGSVSFRSAGLGLLLWRILIRKGFVTHPHVSVPEVLREMLSLSTLVRYLDDESPTVMFSVGDFANMVAVRARRLSDVGSRVRLIVSHHAFLSALMSERVRDLTRLRAHLALRLFLRTMLQADAIVGTSKRSSDDLAHAAGIPPERITTIENPVVNSKLLELAKRPAEGPWFLPDNPPVVLSAGRLCDQKDFATLIRAFARVRRDRKARLVILGEGENRRSLEALAEAQGVADDVVLPGFLRNPYACMARAAVFVLSSKWEALPLALTEALACGCPIVATDCPSGPAEILSDGEFGALVPVGDDAALAKAILRTLDDPPSRDRLVQRGMHFTAERAAERYAKFIPGDPGDPGLGSGQ